MSEILVGVLTIIIAIVLLYARDERTERRKLENIILQLAIGSDTVDAVAKRIREKRAGSWRNRERRTPAPIRRYDGTGENDARKYYPSVGVSRVGLSRRWLHWVICRQLITQYTPIRAGNEAKHIHSPNNGVDGSKNVA